MLLPLERESTREISPALPAVILQHDRRDPAIEPVPRRATQG